MDFDEELKKIQEQKEIEEQRLTQENLPSIDFEREKTIVQNNEKDTATDLVESAFNQAVVHKVKTDEKVQTQLLDSADKVIQNKVNAVKERAELEDKEAHFNNKKGACECFGYNEKSTEKWAVNVMSWWHNIMTAIWVLIGSFTFAPITFVAKKIKVIFKATWLCVAIALIIYLAILSVPLITGLLNK
jgi:hypothetical protein